MALLAGSSYGTAFPSPPSCHAPNVELARREAELQQRERVLAEKERSFAEHQGVLLAACGECAGLRALGQPLWRDVPSTWQPLCRRLHIFWVLCAVVLGWNWCVQVGMSLGLAGPVGAVDGMAAMGGGSIVATPTAARMLVTLPQTARPLQGVPFSPAAAHSVGIDRLSMARRLQQPSVATRETAALAEGDAIGTPPTTIDRASSHAPPPREAPPRAAPPPAAGHDTAAAETDLPAAAAQAATTAQAQSGDGLAGRPGLAALLGVLIPVGSWSGWYLPLIEAAQQHGTERTAPRFLLMAHVAFCLVAALGLPGTGLVGVFVALQARRVGLTALALAACLSSLSFGGLALLGLQLHRTLLVSQLVLSQPCSVAAGAVPTPQAGAMPPVTAAMPPAARPGGPAAPQTRIAYGRI